MFPKFEIDIRLFPSRAIYRYPEDQPPVADPAWEWLRTTSKARCFLPEETLPWGGRLADQALVLAPVFEPGSADPIGGVVLTQPMQAVWNAEEVANSLPAIQTLASQIGSALHGAELYRMEQELLLAGQIQASFLPDELPEIPGWQLAAALEPARQTAGDFYDVIPLPNGRFGIVVADVADKGMGAALYMALARTLLRTYALEYHTRPDFAMKVTNRRILMDTDVTMFVSAFYGILAPRSGQLTYCNAGHNPPYVLPAGGEGPVQALSKTGMVIGAMPGVSWEQHVVQLGQGDMLVLYTDGVTDAQNRGGAFFGREQLLNVLQIHAGQPAHKVRNGVLRAVRGFTDGASQFDDITLVIAVRGLHH